MTEAGSQSDAQASAADLCTYQRFPIRRAGRLSGISRRIFWQFELEEPPTPTSPNHSSATCSTVIRRLRRCVGTGLCLDSVIPLTSPARISVGGRS